MNVLLVTTANNLAEKLNALNPELEYAAIVTDDIETAKKTLAQVGLDKCFVSSMDELIRCVEYLWYDYIICVQDYFYDQQINRLEGLPVEKIICFAELQTEKNFQTERVLRYYQEHVQDFEMFATGISYIWDGLDITQFKRKLLNFAKQSQDLYYDFNIAKSVILCGGGIISCVMLLSDWLNIRFTTIFLNLFFFNGYFYLILLFLMIRIIFLYLARVIKNS